MKTTFMMSKISGNWGLQNDWTSRKKAFTDFTQHRRTWISKLWIPKLFMIEAFMPTYTFFCMKVKGVREILNHSHTDLNVYIHKYQRVIIEMCKTHYRINAAHPDVLWGPIVTFTHVRWWIWIAITTSIQMTELIWQGLRCCRKLCKFCQQNSDASQEALTLVHNSSIEGQHAKDSEYV